MLVEDCIIIENKAVDQILPIHQAQLLTLAKVERNSVSISQSHSQIAPATQCICNLRKGGLSSYAQLLTYLKLRNCRLGFILNWNVRLMKDGIKRMVNNYDSKTSPVHTAN